MDHPSHPHCRHTRQPAQTATDALRGGKHKLTGPRKAILEALSTNDHPLTAAEIHSRMPRELCDLATIYRSVKLLQKTGLVQRYDFGDGKARFELTCGQRSSHHHHLVCTRCARIVEIEECTIREMERTIAQRSGFKSVSHRLEFFGICPACQ